jgi:proteasome accessory factor A
MLERLIGMETEYATLVRTPQDQAEPPSRRDVYSAVCEQISKRLPTARGRFDSNTIFLANGGAFSIEGSPTRLHLPGGLIEGATAETSSPSRLLECQRAQDRIIADAAATCSIPGSVKIIKNSADAHGHVYGCQENYTAEVATGFGLLLYWLAMITLIPFAIGYWIACLTLLASEMGVLVLWRSVARLWRKRLSETQAANDDREHRDQITAPLPPRLLLATAMILRIASLPVAGLLYFTAKTIAFRKQRKYLTAFLISRVVITGAGHVDRSNRFRLSSKAMAIDTVTGFGGYLDERPIFVFHHWLQQLCGRSLLSLRSLTSLFRQQQRLQIGLSDSNAADTAEFLKVGTTSLVLDMIEAGWGADLPRLLSPIDALHRIAADWDLVARVPTTRGKLSGLEIQRAYLRACQEYASSQPDGMAPEVQRILSRWESTLDALAAFRSASMDPRPALGHVDWLTKKWMLDRLDEEVHFAEGALTPAGKPNKLKQSRARWAARKKIDIRYHELSADSYYAKLLEVSPEVSSVDQQAIELALRLPPNDSPATRRGQLIREFCDGSQTVAADWSHVIIGTGKDRKVVTVG